MLARVCAAQMARTIVRALHVAPDQQPLMHTVEKVATSKKKKTAKGRKKKAA